ncbi:MAG: hypothetical protein ACKN9A_20040, partial [Microcystis aeruginosa]
TWRIKTRITLEKSIFLLSIYAYCKGEMLPFRTLLEDLGTIYLNTVECTIREGSYRFSKITRPTQLQQKALDLLEVSLICTQ